MAGVVKDAVLKRVSGDKPSTVKAGLAALVAGAAVTALTYRALRS